MPHLTGLRAPAPGSQDPSPFSCLRASRYLVVAMALQHVLHAGTLSVISLDFLSLQQGLVLLLHSAPFPAVLSRAPSLGPLMPPRDMLTSLCCSSAVLVSWGCANSHMLGGLKEQRLIPSQFWRPEVCQHGPPPLRALLAPGGPGVPWLLQHYSSLCLCRSPAFSSLCFYVPSLSLLRMFSLNLGPTLLPYELTLRPLSQLHLFPNTVTS